MAFLAAVGDMGFLGSGFCHREREREREREGQNSLLRTKLVGFRMFWT